MDATIMQSITLLAAKLSADFPSLHFLEGEDFHWSPHTRTIHFDPWGTPADLLHELSHAILEHQDHVRDIQLIKMEQEAWEHARSKLAHSYELTITTDYIQDALDTYRDWLHARSVCPNCAATGIQTHKYRYRCLACGCHWEVNDARICALRRYKIEAN